jgi:isocitrate dehydrogenase
MANPTPITVAHGDGIGPEIMAATLHILKEAGAALDIETIEIGEKVYLRGNSAGIEPSAWESLRRTKVFLKAPITTPQGGGFKSLNVTARKTLGLYANIRPCRSYYPFVRTKHPVMDLVIVRENEEDLYAGIEYQASNDEMLSLKLISRPGSEKIVRYAFEYAQQFNRKKVTCFTKDNIMKMSDGLFHKIFDEIGVEYPSIEKEHWIVDIGAAKMADTPEAFDVIVMPNLYGDVLSDVAAQIAGSVGLAGSSNIGSQCAMFEAIHGSAPRRPEHGQPFGSAARRSADAGPHRPARSRGASAQRLAAHHGRRRPHLRHFQGRYQQTKGWHEGIRRSRRCAPRPGPTNLKSGEIRCESAPTSWENEIRAGGGERGIGRHRRLY